MKKKCLENHLESDRLSPEKNCTREEILHALFPIALKPSQI